MNNYIFNKINSNENTSSIFFNKLYKIQREQSIESIQKNEQIIKSVGYNVIYKYNTLGYRSNEFINVHTSKHILFAGCSETEGCGGNLDTLWSWMLYSKINKKIKTSGFFNIGMAGAGYQFIISNTMSYIKEYGKPDYIFILFPNIGRFIKWGGIKNNEDQYIKKVLPPFGVDDKHKETLSIKKQRELMINFTLSIRLLEEYCNTNNITLLWSTWDKKDSENFQNLNVFSNFILMPNHEQYANSKGYSFITNLLKRTDYDRKRDGHNGFLYHSLWSDTFLDNLTL